VSNIVESIAENCYIYILGFLRNDTYHLIMRRRLPQQA
jgi:hypothetical protein